MRIKKTSQTTASGAQTVNTFSESTENAYSCYYANKLNTYSTDEIRIGTSTDNKPIYRKKVSGTYTTSATRAIVNLVENVDKLVKCYGLWSPNTGVPKIVVGCPDISGGGGIDAYASVRKTDNNIIQFIEYSVASSYVGITGSYEITLEYTKTTD